MISPDRIKPIIGKHKKYEPIVFTYDENDDVNNVNENTNEIVNDIINKENRKEKNQHDEQIYIKDIEEPVAEKIKNQGMTKRKRWKHS